MDALRESLDRVSATKKRTARIANSTAAKPAARPAARKRARG
jgi:hypothetical protein